MVKNIAGLAAAGGMAAGMLLVGPAEPATAQGEFSVLTLNTWQDAGNVDDGLTKTVDAISQSGAQVVALQEASDEFTGQVADELGWYHTSAGTDVNVISQSPIDDEADTTTPTGANVAGALIQGTWIYSTHLDYQDYGPYNACFENDSYPEIYRAEQTRGTQAKEVTDYVESATPTIVAGDFNSPSQYDWTEDTQDVHCDSVVDWPATQAFYDADYWDSFREVNDDEAAIPGNTWSPVVKQHGNGQPEPQDRIDFIQYKGGSLDATASSTYGSESDAWPSDHLGVLTTFAS